MAPNNPTTGHRAPPLSPARTFRVVLSYDGTDFAGFQRQSNARSVQQVLEEALAPIDGQPVVVSGAGRTDSGVHALGQVVSFRLSSAIPAADLKQALNATFNAAGAADVRVLSVDQAPESFHARFSARGKLYRYRLLNADVLSPFERRFAWHIQRPLDLELMRRAARDLVGEHDFASFQAAGGDVKTSVRTIARSDWTETPLEEDGRLLQYDIAGNGFLKHMVRSIVGTLVEIGCGRRDADSVRALLSAPRRSDVGQTAPPHGLYLVCVDYDAAGPVSFS